MGCVYPLDKIFPETGIGGFGSVRVSRTLMSGRSEINGEES